MTKVVSNRRQILRLVEIMEENIEIARGTCSKTVAQKKWEQIAVELNSLGPPERTWEKWQRVWVDLKCKTKKKKTEITATGGGRNKLHIFTDAEEAILRIMQLNAEINPVSRDFGTEHITVDAEYPTVDAEDPTIDPISETLDVEVLEEPNTSVRINTTIPLTPRRALTSRQRNHHERTGILEKQMSDQNDFYNNATDALGDIKDSLNDIKYYYKKNYHLKKEKLEIYKKYLEEKTQDRKEKREYRKQKAQDRKVKLQLNVKLLQLAREKRYNSS